MILKLTSLLVLQILSHSWNFVEISLNKIDNDESTTGTESTKEKEEGKEAAISLLKTLYEILRNKIKKKQEEVHKTQNIAENDRICIEINTLH